MRADGEAEDGGAGGLGLGKRGGAGAFEVSGLQVDGDRVVNGGPDSAPAQMPGKGLPVGMADDILMIHRFGIGRGLGQAQAALRKRPVVNGRDFPAARVFLVEEREARPENRRLDFVQAAVEAGFFADALLPPAILAQSPGTGGERSRRSGNGAGIAKGAEILCGIKAECGHRTEPPHAMSIEPRAMRLRGVFDNLNPREPRGDGKKGVHGRGHPEEMDRNNGPDPRVSLQRTIERDGVHGHGTRINLDEKRAGAGEFDGGGGGHRR